ncbi:copper chaperone PCu(A)C [Kordiimonas aquimaris]|uniref:copper chaperone PCu(A)C n=1 Tax=Kordiimonas aquimaris TaxID=707591 RepID=UPI0021CEDB59|nr:copper chaperone PCu(A)C [Kordiimonas aquimaris]
MTKMLMTLLLTFCFAHPVFAHGNPAHESLDLSNAWARKTGRRSVSAAVYFDIHNQTHAQETLTAVSSDRAAIAMIHRSFEQDDIMRMEMQDEVPIAPAEKLSFEPGSYHVMLIDLTEPLVEGDVFPVTLSFKNAGDVTIYVEVTGISGPQN